MRYLFFDIECCNGRNICEFGYVLSDDKFNVLERDCITINPEQKFKLSGREHESDITLAFSEEVYNNSPVFSDVYERIRRIITTPGCQIIGFSMHNDCNFLATAYSIYGLEPIKFTYIDFQKLYQSYTKAKQRTSVEGFVKELEIENVTLHKSDDDSCAVLLAIKKISEKEHSSFADTITILKKSKAGYMVERAKDRNLSIIEKINSGNEKAQKDFIKAFIHKLTVNDNATPSLYKGKVISISGVYQKNHFNEFLTIIERIHSIGATYTGKASECEVFVEYSLPNDEDNRILSVQRMIIEGKSIAIISLDKALKELHLTKSVLSLVDHINAKSLESSGKRFKKNQPHSYIDKNASVILLEI